MEVNIFFNINLDQFAIITFHKNQPK